MQSIEPTEGSGTPPARPGRGGGAFKRKVARGAFWAAARTWGGQGTAFVVFLVLARLLDARDFGLVALAGVYLALLDMLTEQGFGTALVQRANLEEEHLDSAFWVSVGIGLVLTLATIVLSSPVARLFDVPRLAPILDVMAISVLFVALRSVQEAQFRRELRFKVLAVRTIVANLAGGAAGISLAFAGFGVWALVGMQLTQEATALVVLWTASKWRPQWRFSRRHVRDLMGFSLDMMGTRLLGFANRRISDIIIAYMLGPAALGFFTIGYRIVSTIDRTLISTVTQVAIAAFSRVQLDRERMRRGYYKATQFTGLVGIPVFLFVAVMAPVIVPLLFGEKWATSIAVTQVLAIAGLQLSIGSVNGAVILSTGRADLQLRLLAGSVTIGAIAIAIGARWGVVGVATAMVVRSAIMAPIRAAIVRRLIGTDIPHYLRQFMAPAVATAILVLALLTLRYVTEPALSGWTIASLSCVVALILYVGTLRLVQPSVLVETFQLLNSALPARFRRAGTS